MKRNYYIWLIWVGISLSGCSDTGACRKEDAIAGGRFTLPSVPVVYTSDDERNAYLATHYWEHFNFSDTTLIGNADITEQAFADFLARLQRTPQEVIPQSICHLLEKALAADTLMFAHFTGLLEKYLYDPNSPYRDYEWYASALNYVVASEKIGSTHKMRPAHQLEMIHKNRVGEVATDFVYTLANGKTGRLSQIKADYTILFFNNPDCDECRQNKEYITSSPLFRKLFEGTDGIKLVLLALYVDDDLPLWRKASYPACMINGYDAGQVLDKKHLYDLRAIPSFYLLDRDKKVLLKDTKMQEVEFYLENLNYK